MITRALGTDPDVDGDVFPIETEDRRRLPALLRRAQRHGRRRSDRGDPRRGTAPTSKEAAQELVKAANKGGGEDNITVLLFEVGAADRAHRGGGPPSRRQDDDEDTLSGARRRPRHRRQAATSGRRRTATSPEPVVDHPPPRRSRRQALLDHRARHPPRDHRRSGSSASRSRTSSEPRRTATSPSTRAFPRTSRGIHLYRRVYVSRVLAAQLTQPERQHLFDHDLRGLRLRQACHPPL